LCLLQITEVPISLPGMWLVVIVTLTSAWSNQLLDWIYFSITSTVNHHYCPCQSSLFGLLHCTQQSCHCLKFFLICIFWTQQVFVLFCLKHGDINKSPSLYCHLEFWGKKSHAVKCD